MRVVVDVGRCRGAGLCALTAPDVFDQDEEDGTVLVLDAEPPPDQHQAVSAAARLCPNSVIRLEDCSRAATGRMTGMDVLSSRVLLRPSDLARSHRFYRDTLGLAVHRQFGTPEAPGLVFFLGNGFLEVSGRSSTPPGDALALWVQVRDVHAEHGRLLELGVPVLREPRQEPWGLVEMWLADPDGVRIVLVEVPEDHPLRRDQRDPPAHAG